MLLGWNWRAKVSKTMTMEQGMVFSNRDIVKIRSKAGLANPTVVFADVSLDDGSGREQWYYYPR
jgi:hypothetical protein